MKTLICIFIAYFGLSSAETIPELAEKLNGLKFIRLLDDVGLTDMLSGTGKSIYISRTCTNTLINYI